jgi:hypothetical protein
MEIYEEVLDLIDLEILPVHLRSVINWFDEDPWGVQDLLEVGLSPKSLHFLDL